MKKNILMFSLFVTGILPANADTFIGVTQVDGNPVSYSEPDMFGAVIAFIGDGRFAGDCYHDNVHYAVIKGLATCPGYDNVFPTDEHQSYIMAQSNWGIELEGIPPMVINSTQQANEDCNEITNIFDPFR